MNGNKFYKALIKKLNNELRYLNVKIIFKLNSNFRKKQKNSRINS